MTTELAPPRPSRITEQDTVDFYFTKAWQEEDPCFERLVYLYLQCRSEEPDKVEGVRQAMGEHQETCGGCFRNVFVAAEEFTEQLRKQVYFNIHELAAYEFMKFSGGDYEIENNGAGIRIRLIYPPADQDVLRGIESFTPHDKSVPGWLTIDVLTQRDFESPGRLLDVIDTQDAALVRDNADPKYAVLQWLGIAHGRGSELRFRWDGRVRKVAEGTTLHDRYGALAAKMRGLFAADRSPAQHDPGRDVSAEVLLLYDVAKSYSGRIPFSRYVKPVMKRQLVDAYRDRKPDAAHADHRGEIAAPSAATRDTNESRDAALASLPDMTIGHPIDPLIVAQHRERSLQLLHARLSTRRRQILNLKLTGLTDEEIGTRLGVSRKTVNQHLSVIRVEIAGVVRDIGSLNKPTRE